MVELINEHWQNLVSVPVDFVREHHELVSSVRATLMDDYLLKTLHVRDAILNTALALQTAHRFRNARPA
jgi:hypothetical protein